MRKDSDEDSKSVHEMLQRAGAVRAGASTPDRRSLLSFEAEGKVFPWIGKKLLCRLQRLFPRYIGIGIRQRQRGRVLTNRWLMKVPTLILFG